MNVRRLLSLAVALPAAVTLTSCATLMNAGEEAETSVSEVSPADPSAGETTAADPSADAGAGDPTGEATEETGADTGAAAPGAEDQDVFDMAVGDCIEDIESIFGGADSVDQVTKVGVIDCGQPHNAEVYHAEDLPDGDFPGMTELTAQSEQICLDNFEAFAGEPYLQSDLEVTYFHPTEQSWGYGDRTVNCMIVSAEPTTGSAAGA